MRAQVAVVRSEAWVVSYGLELLRKEVLIGFGLLQAVRLQPRYIDVDQVLFSVARKSASTHSASLYAALLHGPLHGFLLGCDH